MTKPMITKEELKLTKELCEEATPGPWRFVHESVSQRLIYDGRGWLFAQGDDDGNLKFIAQSRTLVPKLIEEIERLHSALEYYADISTEVFDSIDGGQRARDALGILDDAEGEE